MAGLSDDLRTRIAVVLSEHDPEGSALCDHHYELADVLIRELGLRQERVELLTRYVTGWVLDA